jgi:hypothetical protein
MIIYLHVRFEVDQSSLKLFCYTSMYERLNWLKVLIGELILCNAVKDICFTSMMKFKKLKSNQEYKNKLLINFTTYGSMRVIIVIHDTRV